MGTQRVTKSLTCGTCAMCEKHYNGRRVQLVCTLFDRRVMSYYPFCEFYENSLVASDYETYSSLEDTGRTYRIIQHQRRVN